MKPFLAITAAGLLAQQAVAQDVLIDDGRLPQQSIAHLSVFCRTSTFDITIENKYTTSPVLSINRRGGMKVAKVEIAKVMATLGQYRYWLASNPECFSSSVRFKVRGDITLDESPNARQTETLIVIIDNDNGTIRVKEGN